MDTKFSRNPKEHELLKDKHFAFIGLGSFGSALAMMSARAGLRKFTLVDPDILSPENIGRHFGCSSDVGLHKVAVVVKAVSQVQEVEAIQVTEKFNGRLPAIPDFIVCCTDSFSCDSLVNSYALACGIPAVFVGCWGAASVGEIYWVIPGKTACYHCFASFRKQNTEIPNDPRKYTDPNFDSERVLGQPGLWANILAICGIAFNVTLGILCGRADDYGRNLILFNLTDFECGLQPLAVTLGRVERGCIICDESLLPTPKVQ